MALRGTGYAVVHDGLSFVAACTSLERAQLRAAEISRRVGACASVRVGRVDDWSLAELCQHRPLGQAGSPAWKSSIGAPQTWSGVFRTSSAGRSLLALFSSEKAARLFVANNGSLIARRGELFVVRRAAAVA